MWRSRRTLTAEALADAVATYASTSWSLARLPLRTLSMVAELRKRSSVPVLCVRSAPASSGPEGGSRMLCVDLSSRGRSAVVRFIRDHASPPDRAVLLSSEPLSSEDLLRLREVSDIPPEVNLTGTGEPLRYLLDPQVRQGFDLIVLPRFPPVVSLAARSGPPVLILPPLRPAGLEWERTIDVPDLVDDGALIRARLEYAVGVGRRTPIADQEVAFVRASEIVARATFRQGEAELPSGLGNSLGVFRTYGKDPTDPLAALEGRVAVLRADARTLILFDAEIDNDQLSLIRRVTWADAVGVRVRSMRSCASLRAKLRAAGLPPLRHRCRCGARRGRSARCPRAGRRRTGSRAPRRGCERMDSRSPRSFIGDRTNRQRKGLPPCVQRSSRRSRQRQPQSRAALHLPSG